MNRLKNKAIYICCFYDIHFICKDTYRQKVMKGWKSNFCANESQNSKIYLYLPILLWGNFLFAIYAYVIRDFLQQIAFAHIQSRFMF